MSATYFGYINATDAFDDFVNYVFVFIKRWLFFFVDFRRNAGIH